MYIKNLIDIYDSKGRKIDTDTLGVLGLRLQIPSPSYNSISQDIDGQIGTTIFDRILQPRKLTADFLTIADDYKESLFLRDKLYRLLGGDGYFFVGETEVPGRRWRVYQDEWTPERRSVKVQTFQIPLVCAGGFAESTVAFSRMHTTTTFRFNNEGDLTIDPRIHSELSMEFWGPSTNLRILNNTTGEEWSWTGSTGYEDAITLSGIKSLKNGSSIFGQTNKKLLTIAPGWNDFQLIGTSGPVKMTIKSRFYYL